MKKDSSELILEWSEKIRRQKFSNKSVAAWCKEEGISSNTFQYWNKKIKKTIPQQSLKNDFLEIPEDPPLIEVSLQGIKIALSKDFDRSGLIYFLNLLRA